MNKVLEKLKQEVMGDDFKEKIYLKDEDVENENKKDVYKDAYDKYYKIVDIDVTDEEFNQFMTLKSIKLNKELAENIHVIKNILYFWLALTIIGILGFLYMWNEISSIL